MQPIPRDHPLRTFFAGVVEQTFFTEVGLCAPPLTDYLTDLLVDFTHIDQWRTLHNISGKRIDQIVNMLTIGLDESIPSAERERLVYRHLGDFMLFWAGVYPEHIRRSVDVCPDPLADYVCRGKQSYAVVSDLSTESALPPSSLFRQLSEEFESCVHGLGLVRRELVRTPLVPPEQRELLF